MKAIFLFLSLLAYCITFSQDVVIFIQAELETSPVELDTIFVENLSNGTFAKLYDLPNGVTNYEINLSQGAQVNAIGQINEPSSNFTLLSNKPGVCSFQIISKPQSNVTFDLYNIHGQKLYHEIKNLTAEISTFEFYNSHSNIGVLKITTVDNCYSIKVIGNANYQTILCNTVCNVLNTPPTIKELRTNFEFNEGDTLRITAIKQAFHSNSIFIQPINTENYIIYISQPCAGIATVTDYDGNVYNTVKIGNQCWLKENLKATHYSDGTALVNGSLTGIGGDDIYLKAFYNFEDNDSLSELTGKLYTWAAAINGYVSNNDVLQTGHRQGICPIGWHIPSDEEWGELELFADNTLQNPYVFGLRGSIGGSILKSNLMWNTASGNNKYGFTILPGGRKENNILNNAFEYVGYNISAGFWTSTYYQGNGVFRYFFDTSTQVGRGNSNPAHSYSVRCIKD
jgi:uncharacterized protein (TIGR02145 family)